MILKNKNKNNKLVDEIRNEIFKLSEKIDNDDLTYLYKGKNIGDKSFNDFDNAFSFFVKIKLYELNKLKVR